MGAASFNFGCGNIVIALAIATMKATLVALFFMHLLWDKPVNAIIAVAGFLFLGIFLMFDFLDVTSRVNYLPNNMPQMENATPAPDSMNPLRTPAPRPRSRHPPHPPPPESAKNTSRRLCFHRREGDLSNLFQCTEQQVEIVVGPRRNPHALRQAPRRHRTNDHAPLQ